MRGLLGDRWGLLMMAMGLTTAGLGACVPMGGRGLGGGSGAVPTNRAVQELYVKPGVTQYFLLPQTLEGPAGQYAELDIVVRDSAQVPLYGLVHLSVVAPTAVRVPADTLLLSGPARPVAMPTTRVLFAEPKGKATTTRLEVYLTPAQTLAYLRATDRSLWLGGSTGRRHFEPGRKAATALAALASQVAGPAQP